MSESAPVREPFGFQVVGLAPALARVPIWLLAAAAVWMAAWYGAWLYLQMVHGEHSALALAAVIVGFAPFLIWALIDYRKGLLLTVMATPFFVAPVIPHGFTQGFGDLFAAFAVLGYLFRHPHPRNWLRLWQPGYIWLVLIVLVAAISLLAAPPLGADAKYGVKYGLAEIAGYSLAITYLAVLAHEIRDVRDMQAVLKTVGLAVLVVIYYGLIGAEMSRICVSGYYGANEPLSSNEGIASTFFSTNYHASYILAVLPLALLFYLRSASNRFARLVAAAVVVLLVFFVQGSLSRAGLLGLTVVWAGWFAITRWQTGSRMMSIALALMLPLTFLIWWYPACTCSDAPPSACVPWYVVKQELAKQELAKQGIVTVTREVVIGANAARFAPKGWTDSIRLQLIENALTAWCDYPLTGVGVGRLADYSFAGEDANRSHNVVLTVLAEQGLLGLLAWGGWWLFLASLFWRHRQELIERGHTLAFLALSFAVMTLVSMFADQYRVIWLWQLGALIVAFPRMLAKGDGTYESRAR